MAIRDEDFGTDLTLAEGDAGIWSPSQTAPASTPPDWQSLYERQRARVEADEARCEDLRRAELESRSRAGSLKSQLDASRNKLRAAEEEIREVRRTAKNALALQAEVTRLEKLLSEAGVEASKRSTIMSLRKEVARLRKAASVSEGRPRGASGRSRNPEEKIASLREENARLKKEVRAAKGLEGRIKFLDREIDNLRYSLRASHAHNDRIKARHRDEIDWLKRDMDWLRAACAQRAGDRKTTVIQLRQRERRPVHGRDVLGRRHARLERHGRPALAGSVAGSMREERRACAGRPVAVAAMVDERGAQARLHGGSMTGRVECRYYGRDFTAGEMALLRALIAVDPQPTRAGLSREFCRLIGWFKPDGGLKDMMARVTMLAMHRDGLVVLPPPKGRQHRPKPVVFGPDTEPPLFPAPTTLAEVRPLDLRTVVRGTREGRLWNEFVARYHYLGYKTLVGAQMRYAVHDRNGWPVAMLGFSTATWKLAPRDRFIGWTPQLREKNLPLVVDNPRFLILPWITIPNLGSHILALIRRRLPLDWAERYNTTPVLIETFVETPRYTGAVYKASGWIHVGTTQGRGRYDRDKLYDKPRKDIWLRPLRKDWKRALNR